MGVLRDSIGRRMSGTDWRRLTMELDVRAATFTLDALGYKGIHVGSAPSAKIYGVRNITYSKDYTHRKGDWRSRIDRRPVWTLSHGKQPLYPCDDYSEQ